MSENSTSPDPPLEVGQPIVWRLALAAAPEEVFALLDTDEGRERHWARSSHATPEGFDLEFSGGLQEEVKVIDCRPPHRMTIRYFGSTAALDLSPREGGGCDLQVTCRCDDPNEWMHFYPGWVSWLLVLKAAADFGVDLRNGSPERTWSQRYVDP
jgi:uncharacterized protein YndB with AHSA1/START domain